MRARAAFLSLLAAQFVICLGLLSLWSPVRLYTMGPLLRSAEEGADTMLWLAATGDNGAPAGQFWLDRDTRGTAYLPCCPAADACARGSGLLHSALLLLS